jgi:hypothetical protein
MSARPHILEYRPLLLSRRGEYIAWGAALLVAAAWFFLTLLGRSVFLAMPILEILLLFSAASMSLGNWMDRRTVLRLSDQGLSFQNGLRDIRLKWDEICKIYVIPTQWGKKAEVIGEREHFQFRTLGEVKVQGEVKGRMGFEKGDEALDYMISRSGLQQVEQPGEGPGQGYYYARK